MHKSKSLCVQGQTMDYRRLRSISTVACYRMAKLFHMHAYLILAACLKRHLNHRMSETALYHLVTCDGELALIGIFGRVHLMLAVFSEIAAYLALVFFDISLYHTHILA